MMKTFVKIFSLIIFAQIISSCNNSSDTIVYKLEPEAAMEYAASNDDMLELIDFTDMVKFPENYPNVQFVDLRTPDEFDEGHIPGAVNIPLKSLISEESCESILSKDKTNILYGKKGDNAAEAGLLLKMIGRDNFLICPADYSFIKQNILDEYSIHSGVYNNEKARYDYAEVTAETPGNNVTPVSSSTSSSTPIIKREKKEVGGGGCD